MTYTREQIEEEIKGGCVWLGANTAADMLRQLLAENDALREDAERYRKFASDGMEKWHDDLVKHLCEFAVCKAYLDCEIDAARKKG